MLVQGLCTLQARQAVSASSYAHRLPDGTSKFAVSVTHTIEYKQDRVYKTSRKPPIVHQKVDFIFEVFLI